MPVPPLARTVGYVVGVRAEELGSDEAYVGVVVAVDRFRRALRVRYEPDPALPRRYAPLRLDAPSVGCTRNVPFTLLP